jgi:hypothetical protein
MISWIIHVQLGSTAESTIDAQTDEKNLDKTDKKTLQASNSKVTVHVVPPNDNCYRNS